MSLKVTSPVFEPNAPIPAEYTGDGNDISPPLEWSGAPEGTASYALIMDDPDAPVGLWIHWVAWNIHSTKLPENAAQKALAGASPLRFGQGTNSWKRVGYGGPCPPSGVHRYYFKLYALDTDLKLDPKTTKRDLLEAMEAHVRAAGELIGTYGRSG